MTPPGISYERFLAAKAQLAEPSGFLDVDPSGVHPLLLPHQRDTVAWAVRGGRRAIFANFGLGKTFMQLEILRLVIAQLEHEDGAQPVVDSRRGPAPVRRGLIILPLGVRQEFTRDAAKLDLTVTFIRDAADATQPGIYLTNYESVRDGKLDPRDFDVVSLDEAAVLRGLGGTKTFREFMRLYEGTGNYRFVATATPSPNDYIELLAYAAFLDIMDVGQAKTRFFKRDSSHADRLTLHPHMEAEFWLWVSSWALFLQQPSDLGYPDTGYQLPPLDVRWHEVPSLGEPGDATTVDGRPMLFRDASFGVTAAAAEKRTSLPSRVAKLAELVAADPDEHMLLWHDLEDERRAIATAVPSAVEVWGTQDLDERERRILAFSDGEVQYLATKPVIAGSGCNFQRHCARAIFVGIGFKFADFIQAIHRIHRFLQDRPVRIDLIYTDAERGIRAQLERKWRQHDDLVARMGEIMRTYKLSRQAMSDTLTRAVGVERVEAVGDNYRLVNNDAVLETQAMPDASVDLIVTSIPFATQYEYTPSYNDFGHTEDNDHFWSQMDYLTPQLLRVLAPGRVAAIHVKDRIVPGGLTGLGFQTVEPFSDQTVAHFRSHGFAFLARKTIVTDVVRENNQTYRLGWSEQCKDGSRMGAGMPEYLLLFRRPPTDPANGYADTPVVKDKQAYSRSRWQFDAHGFTRSSGDRPITPADFEGIAHDEMFKRFREHSLRDVYDLDTDVTVGDALAAAGQLPTTFMLLQPASWHPDVWTDVARMRTLNMLQARHGQQMHLCPLQFDIVDRLIEQFSMPGETVLDPFGGLMTVPYCAIKAGRSGVGVELNPGYFLDGLGYVEAAAQQATVPTLFDLLDEAAS